MLSITCEHCGKTLKIDEKYLGQRGKCNHCQGAITVTVAPLKFSAEVSNKSGVRDEVLKAARANCADRGVNDNDQMFGQLAEKIAKGLKQGLGVEGTARLLRDGLGLDTPRAEQLEKYRQSLTEQTQRDIVKKIAPRAERIADYRKSLVEKGLSEADIDKKVAPRAEQLAKYRESLIEKAKCDIEKKVAKEMQHLINARARVIAHTEIGRAMEEGAIANAKADGATHKEWLLSAGACTLCEDNMLAGVIPIDEEFPSGDQTPPAHPSCACTLSYVTDEDGALAAARETQDEERAAVLATREARAKKGEAE